jgi:hypothetical protein
MPKEMPKPLISSWLLFAEFCAVGSELVRLAIRNRFQLCRHALDMLLLRLFIG